MDVDEVYYDAVELLERLIATPRVSRDEADAATLVFEALAGYGPRRAGNNVWVLDPDFDPSRETVLLNSHIDTVRPVDGWTRNPHDPSVEEDRLYGIGSNDAGASLVSLMAAWKILVDRPRTRNFIFLASCEEEVSGRRGVEAALKMLPPINVAVVGEPTGMRPAVAEKGLLVLDGTVRGVSGHAARDEGENAIYKAIEVIDRLRRLEFPKLSSTLGPVKITVTQIEAGTQHNVVPDLCKFVVDVRTTDAYSNTETLEMIRAAVPEAELTPRSTRLQPSSIPTDHWIVTRAAMLGLEPFGSPTLSDQALMAFPSVKIGPGDSARSHHADEYILLSELREAIPLYLRLFA